MDSALRNFFNSSLQTFFEPLDEGGIQLSLADGVVFRDLRINPSGLNETLEKQGVDVRVEGGRVGQMRLFITPIPGTVTVQMSDVDIRVRPNAAKTFGKALLKGINELFTTAVQMNTDDYLLPRPSGPVYYYPHEDQMVEYRQSADVCCLGGPIKKGSRGPPLKTLPGGYKALKLGTLPKPPPYGRRAHLIPCSSTKHSQITRSDDCPDCWAEQYAASVHRSRPRVTNYLIPPQPQPSIPFNVRSTNAVVRTRYDDSQIIDSRSSEYLIENSPRIQQHIHYRKRPTKDIRTVAPYQISQGSWKCIE